MGELPSYLNTERTTENWSLLGGQLVSYGWPLIAG